jgi:hypothetical protein
MRWFEMIGREVHNIIVKAFIGASMMPLSRSTYLGS